MICFNKTCKYRNTGTCVTGIAEGNGDCNRMQGVTTDDAREYFKGKGLTYADIAEGDICTLVMLLNRYIKQACKNHEMSVDTMRMSQKIKSKFTTNGKLVECYLFMNSHYFTQRECISFNRDGFIGFCGWAGGNNTVPIIKAFAEWCDCVTKC